MLIYLSVFETMFHGPFVVLNPEGDEIGGAVEDALDGGGRVDGGHGLLQEVATSSNAASAASCSIKNN
jgi:hypothetical protein